VDAFSELISGLNVRRVLCTRFELSAPWGHEVANLDRVKFVLILHGTCWLRTREYPDPVRLGPGDLFLVLDGRPYSLSDSQRRKVVDCRQLEKLRDGYFIRYGGKGALTSVISVALDLDTAGAKPFFAALPAFIHLKVDQTRGFVLRTLIELMESEIETSTLGSNALVQRLVEALFIAALRNYAQTLKTQERGLFAAMSDRKIGEVIEAMYSDPAKSWNLHSLARIAAMSRSAFATKFRKLSGKAPLEFLTEFRMSRSTHLLKQDVPLSAIATRAGYDSEVSFARAFKRVMGEAPGAFRKRFRDFRGESSR
jgi:AraC-like DNA-binding protein